MPPSTPFGLAFTAHFRLHSCPKIHAVSGSSPQAFSRASSGENDDGEAWKAYSLLRAAMQCHVMRITDFLGSQFLHFVNSATPLNAGTQFRI